MAEDTLTPGVPGDEALQGLSTRVIEVDPRDLLLLERKTCARCQAQLPRSEFGADRSRKDGLQAYCRSCRSIERRARHERDGDRARAQMAVYYLANRERMIAAAQQWKRANVVGDPERKARYQATQREWRRAHPEAVAAMNARRRTSTAEGYSAEEWAWLKASYDYTCLCCGRREPEIQLTPDHVIPLHPRGRLIGGSNDIDNIQPLCKSCNFSKQDKETDYR